MTKVMIRMTGLSTLEEKRHDDILASPLSGLRVGCCALDREGLVNRDRLTKALHAPYFLHKDVEVAEEYMRFARGDNRGNVGVTSMLLLFPMAHPEKEDEWN